MNDQSPQMVPKRRGIVRKFWKSEESQEEWRDYLTKIEDSNICALHFAYLILADQTKSYIHRIERT